MAFVRNRVDSLGLHHAAIGSTESQDAELEPMEKEAQEMVDILKDDKIDPLALLHYMDS